MIKIGFLFVCKCIGLFHAAKWMTRNKLKILCYHGFSIDDESEFRPKLFISPEKFNERLATIKRYGLNVLPLGQATDRLYSRTLPENSIVITIDDGFHSVHRLASPILHRYNYPATVYLTTYYVVKNNPIFRLVVQYMFWKTRKTHLVLRACPWTADRKISLSNAADAKKAMWECIDYGEKMTEEIRSAICEKLGELLEVPYSGLIESRILTLMTPAELRTLPAPEIDVELHTHRHHFPEDEVRAKREIEDNRSAIGEWLAGTKNHFCYPSGIWHEQQWPWLDDLEVRSSTTCIPGLNSHKTPRHGLRRFLDGEYIHQLEFEAALSGFSDLLRGLGSDS